MKIARYILLLILTALLLWGLVWARGRARDTVCRQLVVEVENGDSATLVTSAGIKADLKRQRFRFEGLPMWQINSAKVEEFLAQSPFLEKASVLKLGDGRVVVCVKQIVPVLRVFDGDSSYYVNRQGKHMPTSANYFADVPIVSGHFTRAYGPERLLPLIDYVEHNPELRDVVSQYNFIDSANVFIVPVFYGHVVSLGAIEGYKDKLAKLMLFYRKVMPVKGWETYDTITLKWKHQVVATLRHRQAEQQVEYDPEADEQMPDIETMTGQATAKPAATEPAKQPATEPDDKAKTKQETKNTNNTQQ